MQNQNNIEVVDLGVMKYGPCLELQHSYHEKVVTSDHAGALLLVEHEPVITFGKNADPGFLHFSANHLAEQGIELFSTDRGGEVTAHMPGQLVVYPIINLMTHQLGARDYVCVLEKSVIKVLQMFNINASTHKEYPGVWVGDAKVCAVGVRIKSRATMHGIAFNISNKLDIFNMMTPCGIQGKGVCSLEGLINRSIPMQEIKTLFTQIFLNRLGATVKSCN